MKNDLTKQLFPTLFTMLCFFSGKKLGYSVQGWSFPEKKHVNMFPFMSSSWLYTLFLNMCKQQLIYSKQEKNNSRIEIYKDLYGKCFLV